VVNIGPVETAVGGSAGLTTADPSGPPEPGRHHPRRDVQAQSLKAVVVRTWHGPAYGPAGHTGFWTHASVDPPLPPLDDAEDRRLLAHGSLQESQPPWHVTHPPQRRARAVRVHGMLTLLRCAVATASRGRCEPADRGGAGTSWRRGGTTSSSWRKAATASFSWPSTRGGWG
jgi:hypothetical protein